MPDIVNLQSTLDQKRQELARLEAELKTAQRDSLSRLPAEYGFDSADSLIQALAEFASAPLQSAIAAALDSGRAPRGFAKPPAEGGRKKRVTVSDELRESIAEELKRGTLGANEVALKFNVSASTVNQLKQRLGLTRARAKNA